MRLRTLTATTTAATLLLSGCSGTSSDQPVDEPPAASDQGDEGNEGAAEEVEVPDVVGMSSTAASAALREAGLTANPSEGPEADTPDDAGLVAHQDPEAGSTVEPDTVVDIVRFVEPAYTIVEGPIDAGVSELALGLEEGNEAEPGGVSGIIETLTGTGDDVVDLESPAPSAVVRVGHEGSSNFTVRAVFADGSDTLLVNTIGSYRGEVLAAGNDDLVGFDVTADGRWTLFPMNLLLAADSQDLSRSYTGTGDALVVFPVDFDDPQPVDEFSRATVTHDGESNFVVRELFGRLLANDIGPYEGTVRLTQEGVFGFEVTTDGSWTINLE